MSGVRDIEKAIRQLSPQELTEFRRWYAEFDAAPWDAQFETDVRNGRLDQLAEEAQRDLHEGRCTDL